MENQILSCLGMNCSVCSILVVISNIFRFLLQISGTVAVILLILAGFVYILNLGKEKQINKARTFFKYAMFGFIVAMVSFLIIYSIYRVSGAKNSTGWYKIDCSVRNVMSDNEDNFSDSSYLPNNEKQIIISGSLSGIASGDKKIVKINAKESNPSNFVADIKTLDPDRKINFIAGSKDLGSQYLIDYRNSSLGYDTGTAVEQNNIDQLFMVTTTDADDQYIIEPKGTLKNVFGNEMLVNGDDLNKIVQSFEKFTQVANLGGKDVLAYGSGNSLGSIDSCIDSGGEIISFQNDCYRDREKYGNRNVICTNENNLVNGCNCPSNYYLDDLGRCVKTSELEKSSTQTKTCRDVFLDQKNCPPSRCEGDKMIIYPPIAKDECTDTPNGPSVNRKSCAGTVSTVASDNQNCQGALNNNMSQQQLMQQAQDYYDKNKQTPDWYDKILNDVFGKGSDLQKGGQTSSSGNNGAGADNGTGKNTSTGTDTSTGTGPTDTGPLPPDKGAGNFNPTPTYQELKECIGLPDSQIPYNGILVVLLNPADPLNRNHNENISRMFFLSRNGELIGKNGEDLGKGSQAGGQEYGARDFSKGASNSSMWGRGWKIFRGPTKYWKGGWTDQCSYGSHDGYKTGSSGDPMNIANLRGGKVSSMSRCGQHVGFKNSSAGCATLGNNSRCGFINKTKEYMTHSNGTIMQVNLVGEMNPANGKFSSPDCGKIDYCGAVKSFANDKGASKFKNDPNEGYSGMADKRWVECPHI